MPVQHPLFPAQPPRTLGILPYNSRAQFAVLPKSGVGAGSTGPKALFGLGLPPYSLVGDCEEQFVGRILVGKVQGSLGL